MNSKKVIIISKEIFPRNTPRANRATELAKEFGRQNFDVTIYAVLGNFSYKEFEQYHNVKVKNIGNFFVSKFNSDSSSSEEYFLTRGLKKTLGKWLEFPDIYLAYLSYQILKKEQNIDLLITIAVPHTIHWGVAMFKHLKSKRLQMTTWVADCGDPYIGNQFNKKPFYFKYIEKFFCKKTDFISVPIVSAFDAYYPEFRRKMKVIPQGFNFNVKNSDYNYKKNQVPTFIYAGNFYPEQRDPRPFLDYLVNQRNDFKFIIYTKTFQLLENYKKLLKDQLIILNYIPREQLLIELAKADFLLNFENNSLVQQPSKLIDYALSGRPILNINTKDKLDIETIEDFLSGDYSEKFEVENIRQYEIENVTNKFLQLAINNKTM